jgi:hypothetical protein
MYDMANKKIVFEEFLKRANKKHFNKFEYKDYKNITSKVTIICKKHGKFTQKAYHHLNNCGCPKCSYEKLSVENKFNKTEWIEKAVKKYGNRFDYSLVDYKCGNEEVKIICREHGEFCQLARAHLQGNSGCPECYISKGEKRIKLFLKENNIKFDYQKTFDKCRNKNNIKLSFDFYIEINNRKFLIEYDGEQHYKSVEFFGGKKTFEKRKKYDKIKSKFAIDNKINLIRISYKEFDNIENILKSLLL